METIKLHDRGAAVEDVQNRLASLDLLTPDQITGIFDEATAKAVRAFSVQAQLDETDSVDSRVWAKLVDATFELGDRVLYLRVPFFHGHDVTVLQKALSSLGFSCGAIDGIFGAHTEDALRKFQLNMALPSDGIAGAFTFQALANLGHSWKGSDSFRPIPHLGFARAAEVLEENLICLFGTQDFSRSVAARMSNLAMATTPASKVTSADSLLVPPEEGTLFVHILMGKEMPNDRVPVVEFEPEGSLSFRIMQALKAAYAYAARGKQTVTSKRIALRLHTATWEDAGQDRSAQHYAIVLLDALCAALVELHAQVS